ncbi:MAG: hypothetical protein ACRCU2_30940, partial [Planktothrix sp.]
MGQPFFSSVFRRTPILELNSAGVNPSNFSFLTNTINYKHSKKNNHRDEQLNLFDLPRGTHPEAAETRD